MLVYLFFVGRRSIGLYSIQGSRTTFDHVDVTAFIELDCWTMSLENEYLHSLNQGNINNPIVSYYLIVSRNLIVISS